MGERLRALAEEKGVSAAQLSMGWLLQRARDLQIPTVAIPGTKSLGHALDNIASTRVQLTPAEMTLLEGVAQLASGERESDSYLAAAMEGTSQRGAAAAASSPTTTAAPPPPPPGTHKL
jgi:diketogulonate reductase-like aldo/keto reductase